MSEKKPYILKDISGNLWNFYIDDCSNLICYNSYDKIKLDEKVMEFDININYLGTIQLIYITYDGIIKYSEYYKNWNTQTLCNTCSKDEKIKEIKIKSIDDSLHIFFMFLNQNNEKKADILHYKWSGDKFSTNIITSIDYDSSIDKHFEIDVYGNKIYLWYLNITNSESSLNLSICEKGNWSPSKKLYRLYGTNIEFSTLKSLNCTNILNLTEEKNEYFLEHVSINSSKIMKVYKISESTEPLLFPKLIIQNNNLYALWLEGDFLNFSKFDNGWTNKSILNIDNINDIVNCRYAFEENPQNNLKAKSIFVLNFLAPKFLLPDEGIEQEKLFKENISLLSNCNAEKTIQKLLKDLSINKALNDKLEKRIHVLKLKLYEKDITLNNYNDYLNKTIAQKKVIEKDYNLLIQNQNKDILDTEKIKKELSDEKLRYDSLDKKVKQLITENTNLKNKVIKIKEFENAINKIKMEKSKCETNCKHIRDLEFKLTEKEKENLLIKEELENYKNKNLIGKLFKIKR
ncbi:hypothetical protein ACER0A_003680 [Haloimpatiens sp. FM7315]|uniref:hypothetical protein n=1 Tax=Haloimpatiens sp. FM7315 TaxID=3298609 RepID=UPI003977647B